MRNGEESRFKKTLEVVRPMIAEYIALQDWQQSYRKLGDPLAEFMLSIGYRAVSGLRDREQGIGPQTLEIKEYQSIYKVSAVNVRGRTETIHTFKASPPLSQADVKEAKERKLDIFQKL